jgi:group I intron endonuclease
MGRGLYYGSYKSPRILLWTTGVIIYVIMMGTAFLGYFYSLTWLNNEMEVLFMTNNFIISPQLKLVLNDRKIKPIIVFEELNKEEVKENLRNKTRKKSGIYGIFNLVTGDLYIGSAVTNKFYSRFYKHLIRGLGNKNIALDLNKYGIESFAFTILEYYPEEVTKKNNPDLMALETYWIQTYLPSYNILLEAAAPSGLGYRHSEEVKQKMKDIYSDERRKQIGLLNKDKSLSDSVKILMREKALNRSDEVKQKYQLASSKSVTLYNKDGTVYMKFEGIRVMAKHFGCDHKTINKFINSDKLFKKQWYVKLD